jgi:hypothetical protein
LSYVVIRNESGGAICSSCYDRLLRTIRRDAIFSEWQKSLDSVPY